MRPPACDQAAKGCYEVGTHLCLPRSQRVVDVIQQVLVHTKTRQWARKPFILADFQRDEIVAPLFGRVEWNEEFEAWLRVYRTLWLETARKNGKSELLAALALVLMLADDEEGAEVYGCALDVDQARLVFNVAERMVELSPLLSRRVTSNKQGKRLFDTRTGSFYQVIPADAAGNLGQNPHAIIFDEVQEQPDGSLWDALRTGFGARMQPLLIGAGTAGDVQAEWAFAEHKYSERVAANPLLDPRRLVFQRNLPMDADIWDEKNWRYPNPAMCCKPPFLSIGTLRDEALEARNDPRKEHSFRRFRGNQWQQAGSRLISSIDWDRCAGAAAESPEELAGRATKQRCFGGLDLSATSDLTSLCWLFPDLANFALWRFWLPRDMVAQLDKLTDNAVSRFVEEGWITACEGAVIDYDDVYRQIDEDRKAFRVVDLNYDRWSAAPIIQQLENRGLTSVQVSQGYALNAPVRQLLNWLKTREITHGGNPVARWNAMSVEGKEDRFERIELVKPKRQASGSRIDGIVALVLAVDGVMRRGSAKPPSRKAVGW
jgi:phage terminase large subunit-like protein